MTKGVLSIVVALLVAMPSFGAESIGDWVKDRPGIKWEATPDDYPLKVTSNDSIMWVGPIEEVNAHINELKETVIEFLCRHLSLLKPAQDGIKEPIQVKDNQTGYFVISLRSPSLPLEKALEFREEIKKTLHFAAVLGEPIDRRIFHGRSAVYVHSEKAMMSDKLRVEIIKNK